MKVGNIKTPVIPKLSLFDELRDYFLITIGLMIYAFAVTCFMLPYQITTGGVTGVSIIIYFATGLEIQNTYFFINAVLLILAIKIIGWKFCFRTIFAVFTLTFFLWLFQRLFQDADGNLPRIVGDQAFMACVIGALLEGLALSICFLNNGSTGGTDIIAAVVNKYKDVSLGNMMMIMDFIIITSCYFVFHDWYRVVFGFATLIISSVTLDYVMNRRRQSVLFFIISEEYEKIADAINAGGRGVTVLDAKGWYTKNHRPVLMVLAKKRESLNIFRAIRLIDQHAFVSMSNVSGVFGEGFDKFKGK